MTILLNGNHYISTMMGKKVICRDIHGERHEVAVEDLAFRPSVYGVAIRDGKVLLVPQWDGYDFPGGGVELGETLDEAFRREVFEETGLAVERGEVLVCESDFFTPPAAKKSYHSVLSYYLCQSIAGEISDEHFTEEERTYAKKAEWISLDRLKDIKFCNPVDSIAIIQKATTLSH